MYKLRKKHKETFNVRPISYSQAYPRLSLLLPIFLKIEAGFILKPDSC